MILCICAIICWIIIVFSLTFLQQQKTDKKLSQVSKRLLLCCFSFLVFFYFPHRNMFQNAEPLKIDLTSNEETASLKGILSKERSNTILETCNHLYISRSVLKTLFDRSNGAIAYIYFSGRYDNRAKNYIAVKSSNISLHREIGNTQKSIDHIAHIQVTNPLGILTVGFIALLRFRVFWMGQSYPADFLKDIKHRYPKLTGGFHTNIV